MAFTFSAPYVAARIVSQEVVSREQQDFGLFDSKGRELGHSVTITRRETVADPSSNMGRHESEIGTKFFVTPHSMRAGAAFGALPVKSWRHFDDLEAAQIYAAESFAKARKAAAKKSV